MTSTKYENIRMMAMELTARMTDDGRLISLGWQAFKVIAKVPPEHEDIARLAYLAGAEHLFTSLIGILDEGVGETDQDMRRMSLIHEEIEMARAELGSKLGGK